MQFHKPEEKGAKTREKAAKHAVLRPEGDQNSLATTPTLLQSLTLLLALFRPVVLRVRI